MSMIINMSRWLLVTLSVLIAAACVFSVSGGSGTALASIPPYGETFPKRRPSAVKPGKGMYLVAGRRISDHMFSKSVVLILDYGPHGASGLIVNRPTRVSVSEALPDFKGLEKNNDPLYLGGPVHARSFKLLIRSSSGVEGAERVFGDVYVSGSKEVLARLAGKGGEGASYRVYAGYAGWSGQQLDMEILRGDWYVVKAEGAPFFDKEPEALWQELVDKAEGLK